MVPRIKEVASEEVMEFIENKKLHGHGLSWVDLQILACALTSECGLLTYDKKLTSVFAKLKVGVAFL